MTWAARRRGADGGSGACCVATACVQGSGKELIQPVLDNQLKAASPLVLPPRVSEEGPSLLSESFRDSGWQRDHPPA